MLGTSEPLLLSFPQLEICGLDGGEGLPTTNIIIWGYIILAFASILIFSGVKYVTRFSNPYPYTPTPTPTPDPNPTL